MVFLLTESQVVDENMLVLVNDLLASGEVPGGLAVLRGVVCMPFQPAADYECQINAGSAKMQTYLPRRKRMRSSTRAALPPRQRAWLTQTRMSGASSSSG